MPDIVHFGVGNFHRAHQAAYTEFANRIGGAQWQVHGVSLRSPAIRDLLKSQQYSYTLMISDSHGTHYEWISALQSILVPPQDTADILHRIAAPETQIITLTVTEKGYHLVPDTGVLDLPAVRSDISGAPQSLYGFLARGLQKRRDQGSGPITIMSCDNLASNGDTLAAAMEAFVSAYDPSLVRYLQSEVTFPNCMVDRITPATTDETCAMVLSATGKNDAAPVATEQFSEWVIENRFAGSRPDWERVGVRLVPDVAPFELRKLRMLNGAHSYLAYAGILAGFDHVHEAIADPDLNAGTRAIMLEAMATLPASVRDDSSEYAGSLIDRFANPRLHHKLRQIAMDGSQKIPIRLIATWQERHKLDQPSPAIEHALVAWADFVMNEFAEGRELDDPLTRELAERCGPTQSKRHTRAALLSLIGAPDGLIAALSPNRFKPE